MQSTRKRNRRPGQGVDVGQVRKALRPHAEDLFHAAFGRPANPRARAWRAKGKNAISMEMRGRKRGVWHDFAAGAGGDLLDLVAVTRCNLTSAKSDFPRVLDEAARLCGLVEDAGAWRGFSKPRPRQEDEPDEDETNLWHAATVAALVRRVRDVAGTPAEVYLAGRGIMDLPAKGLGWVPPVPDLPVLHARRGALLVWGLDGREWPVGGQRILVTPSGRRSTVKPRKPAFGRIGGFPARFPARDVHRGGPLVVAEGPESALSIRQATGLECWAVFGVTNWATAPLPKGRTVIFAPDQDGRDSPAGRAFRRAVFVQRARSVDLCIAEAPEEPGSGNDLNDTARRAGDYAVRAAIEAARAVTEADIEEPRS